MSEDLARQVEVLTAQLAEQRAQISSLSQERAANEDDGPRSTIEQLAAQLEQQRLQIASLTQQRIDAIEAGPSRAITIQNRAFDTSRVPDAIKLIMPYKGDKKTLSAWIASVEKKLEHAKKLCSSTAEIDSVMPLWVSVIRDKIVDDASQALVSRHTDCEWSAIKKVLTEYFGDKRDLNGLISQINYLQQGKRGVTEFYNECQELLSDIIDKLACDNALKHCIHTLSQSYETMVVNGFTDGLNDPYAMLTRANNPSTLLAAYQIALGQYNADLRKEEKFSKQAPKVQNTNFERPPPQRGFGNRFQQGPVNRPTQNFPTQNFSTQNFPTQNFPIQKFPNQNVQNRGYFNPQNNRGNFVPPQGYSNYRPPYQNNFKPQNPGQYRSQPPNAIKMEPTSQTGFRPAGNRHILNIHEQLNQYNSPQTPLHSHGPPQHNAQDNSYEYREEIPEEAYGYQTHYEPQDDASSPDDEVNFQSDAEQIPIE